VADTPQATQTVRRHYRKVACFVAKGSRKEGREKQMSERQDLKCKRCGAVVAQTDGPNIYFGEHKVPLAARSLTFVCPDCKRENRWRAATNGKVLAPNHKIG